MSLKEQVFQLQKKIESLSDGRGVTFLAVTKSRTLEDVQSLYDLGIRDFGENRLPELVAKKEKMPSDCRWHFIGTLQSKKVPKLLQEKPFLIHSIDTVELAELISQKSLKLGLKTPILLQVNVSQEVSKHGFDSDRLKAVFATLVEMEGVSLQGLMTMAPLHAQEEELHCIFGGLKSLQKELTPFKKGHPLNELSMGMSQDFEIALKEGSTIVRIGSAIWSQSDFFNNAQ